jgi:surface polysaccharide O-acyltransferase-like enzyme
LSTQPSNSELLPPAPDVKLSITPIVWADRLRNAATVLVVVVHAAASVAQKDADYYSSEWWAGAWWNALGRPAVPLFVMLSGFLLLGKDYPLPDFLKRRFVRVLVPSLFWMAIYTFYDYHSHGTPNTWTGAFRGLLQGPVYFHLWFIYLIIALYLLYPLLRPWVKQATDRDFWYFFILFAIGAWGYKIMDRFWGYHPGLYMDMFTNHIGTFVMGYYFGHKPFAGETAKGPLAPWRYTARQMLPVALTLIVWGTVATAVGAHWAGTTYGPAFNPFFFDYLTPNVGIATIGWFLLARVAWNSPALFAFEVAFAEASFGIYFAHVIIMDWWAESGYWHSKYHPARCIPVVTGLIALMTFVVVALLRSFPGGKRVT